MVRAKTCGQCQASERGISGKMDPARACCDEAAAGLCVGGVDSE